MFDIRPDLVNDPENPGKKMKDYFKAAGKHLLANGAKLLEDMMSYDKDNISHHIIQQIEPFYNDPQFTPEIVEKASRACKAMCMWARAMYKYHQVTLTVGPKKILLRNAQVRTASRTVCIPLYPYTLQSILVRTLFIPLNINHILLWNYSVGLTA